MQTSTIFTLISRALTACVSGEPPEPHLHAALVEAEDLCVQEAQARWASERKLSAVMATAESNAWELSLVQAELDAERTQLKELRTTVWENELVVVRARAKEMRAKNEYKSYRDAAEQYHKQENCGYAHGYARGQHFATHEVEELRARLTETLDTIDSLRSQLPAAVKDNVVPLSRAEKRIKSCGA